jgi:hypothetical protein
MICEFQILRLFVWELAESRRLFGWNSALSFRSPLIVGRNTSGILSYSFLSPTFPLTGLFSVRSQVWRRKIASSDPLFSICSQVWERRDVLLCPRDGKSPCNSQSIRQSHHEPLLPRAKQVITGSTVAVVGACPDAGRDCRSALPATVGQTLSAATAYVSFRPPHTP